MFVSCEETQNANKKATEDQWLLEKIDFAPDLDRSTALFRALAWVFLAARCHAALQAHALATAMGAQCHAGQCGQWRCEFTICFGNDFIAHLWLQENNANRY